MTAMEPIQFEENQRLREISIFILVGIVQLIFLWGLTQQIILHKPWGQKPIPDEILIAINILFLAGLLLLNSINLKTVITEKHILFKMTPFQMKYKIVNWTEVKDISIIKYNGTRDYRYGLRFYTVLGIYGIRIVLNNETKIFIGTHRENEIAQIINELRTRGVINKKD
jgi:hypothetical protein